MTHHRKKLHIGLFILLCIPTLLYADDQLDTDWLKATIGSNGTELGSEVIHIKQIGDTTIIDVELDTENLKDYETVLVIGKKHNIPLEQAEKPELLSKDGEPYGIRFQIKQLPGFEFRLRLYDATDDILQ